MRHEAVPAAAEPTINVVNILRVADAIERHEVEGLGFNMATYKLDRINFRLFPRLEDRSGRDCGTVACLAGTAVALLAPDVFAEPERYGLYSMFNTARDLLGLNNDQAKKLFLPGEYFEMAFLSLYSPANAVRVLRDLAATGEINWASSPAA